MPQASCVLVALCLVAASGSFCLLATSSAVAKHKPSATSKDKSSAIEKKHKSAAVRKKQKISVAKKEKPPVAAREPITIPQPRTPIDKQDCIAAAQSFYGKAQTLAERIKQTVPKEFQQVVSKLDEFCGEEEFEKARTSIDWMSLCLQNFTNDNKVEFCSRNAGYFCAIDVQSDTCVASEGRAEE
jgi:hypothetical protein